jgi:hypothetical protein
MNRHNNKLHALTITAAIFLCIVIHMPVKAQCPVDSCRFIFTHSFFKGLMWDSAASRSDIYLPNEFCTDKPAVFSVSKNTRFNTAVYISKGNKLYASNCEHYTPETGQCQVPWIEFYQPKEIPVSHITLSATTPLSVITENRSSFDTARAAIRLSAAKVEILLVSTSNGFILDRDTVTVSQVKSGQSVAFIGTDFNESADIDTCLWITGSRGMIRKFKFSNGTPGAETVLDANTEDTITCYGQGFAGSSTGSIYRLTSGTFSLNGTVGGAIRFISVTAAAGDNGTAAVNKSGVWQEVSVPEADYLHASNVLNKNGAGVQLLSNSWQYAFAVYADSPTRLFSAFPDTLAAYINDSAYLAVSDGIYNFALSDSDGNHTTPSLIMHTISGDAIDLTADGKYNFPQRDPHALWALDEIQPADSIISVSMTGYSVTVTKNCFVGNLDISCGIIQPVPYILETFHEGFDIYDTLVFAAGADTIRIVQLETMQTASRNHQNIIQNRFIVAGRTIGGRTVISISQSDGDISEVSIFDAAGKTIGRFNPLKESRKIEVTCRAASGMLFVHCRMGNGTVKVLPVPNMR